MPLENLNTLSSTQVAQHPLVAVDYYSVGALRYGSSENTEETCKPSRVFNLKCPSRFLDLGTGIQEQGKCS